MEQENREAKIHLFHVPKVTTSIAIAVPAATTEAMQRSPTVMNDNNVIEAYTSQRLSRWDSKLEVHWTWFTGESVQVGAIGNKLFVLA